MPTGCVYSDGIPRLKLPFENLLRQRILELLLNRTLERPRAVHRIEADIAEQIQRLVAERQLQLPLRKPFREVVGLDPRDLPDLRLVERAEHDDLVEPVDELGPEMRL